MSEFSDKHESLWISASTNNFVNTTAKLTLSHHETSVFNGPHVFYFSVLERQTYSSGFGHVEPALNFASATYLSSLDKLTSS